MSTGTKARPKRDARSRKGSARTTQEPGAIRYGCEAPRIYTKPLRRLTPKTSLGFSVIEFADVIGINLFPWQRWLLIHMLELLPDGSLRFGTVVVLVARQNGKSSLSQVLALWMMMALDWPVVLGTAQDIDTAEKVWAGAVDLLESDEELAPLIRKVNKTNGKKSLVLEEGNEYRVKSANRRAGRGFSGNLILLDELREHQNWFAWAAITHTTMAQLLTLIVCLSNAGDATSVVLDEFRCAAHLSLGDPDGAYSDRVKSTGLTEADLGADFEQEFVDELLDELVDPAEHMGFFEWSAPPGCDRRDRDGWAQANPSMGHIPALERNIARAVSIDPEWVFRTEVLCQWPDGSVNGPFLPGSWEKGRNTPIEDEHGRMVVAPQDKLVGPVWACVDTAFNRSMTYVVWCGRRKDGKLQGEVRAARAGQEWVRGYLLEHADRIQAVTGQTRGAPVSKLMKDLAADREFCSRIPVIEWAGGDLADATGEAFDAVKDVKVRHNPQPVLDVAAAAAATQTLGAVSVIDRKASPVDAAPLVAFIGALWLARRRPAPPPPPPRPPELVTAGPSASRTSETNLNDVGF